MNTILQDGFWETIFIKGGESLFKSEMRLTIATVVAKPVQHFVYLTT